MHNYSIIFYEKDNGEEPVKSFIQKLDCKMQAKLIRILDLLQLNGPHIGLPYSKHLEDGIFEIRVQHGNDICRVLYFFVINRKIILTNGFIKKTQKTPRSEIVLAKRYRSDYERRTHDD